MAAHCEAIPFGGREMVHSDLLSNSVGKGATIFMVSSPERLRQSINPKHSFNLKNNATEFSNPDDHKAEKITVENKIYIYDLYLVT